jgi:hypothetical protein
MKIYMFRKIPFVHHLEFLTVHTEMVYAIQVCRQLSGRIRMELLHLVDFIIRIYEFTV